MLLGKQKSVKMIKINGGSPATTSLCARDFNNSDYTNQYKVREIKSVKKKKCFHNLCVFHVSLSLDQFEHDCYRIALAAQEVTNRPCSEREDI